MKADKRKSFMYRGVQVTPLGGEPRYFGADHGDYLRRWWRLDFPKGDHCLLSTKKGAKTYIDIVWPFRVGQVGNRYQRENVGDHTGDRKGG